MVTLISSEPITPTGIGRQDYSLARQDASISVLTAEQTPLEEINKNAALIFSDQPSIFSYKFTPLAVGANQYMIDIDNGFPYVLCPVGYYLVCKAFSYSCDQPFRIVGFIDGQCFVDVINKSHEFREQTIGVQLTSQWFDPLGLSSHVIYVVVYNLGDKELTGSFKLVATFKSVI